MEVLNTALYYTKVCLGFSSKHEKVDIPEILLSCCLALMILKLLFLTIQST